MHLFYKWQNNGGRGCGWLQTKTHCPQVNYAFKACFERHRGELNRFCYKFNQLVLKFKKKLSLAMECRDSVAMPSSWVKFNYSWKSGKNLCYLLAESKSFQCNVMAINPLMLINWLKWRVHLEMAIAYHIYTVFDTLCLSNMLQCVAVFMMWMIFKYFVFVAKWL